MKRLFSILLVALAWMPLCADSYHDALVSYLLNSDVASKEQMEEQLRPLIQQALPDEPKEANIILKRYVSTRLMNDLADIYDPAFRKHVSEEDMQKMAQIYSDPRFAEIQTKMLATLTNLQSSADFQNLTASMASAMQTIMSGKKPQPLAVNSTIPKDYVEQFGLYYKASQMGELVNQTFAGVSEMLTAQLRNNGVANAEQVTAQLMEYLSGSMPAIMTQLVYKSLSKEDLQMLVDASCSPAYQHTVDAVSEILSDPIGLSIQMMTKMGDWIKINSNRHYKSFNTFVNTLKEAANTGNR